LTFKAACHDAHAALRTCGRFATETTRELRDRLAVCDASNMDPMHYMYD